MSRCCDWRRRWRIYRESMDRECQELEDELRRFELRGRVAEVRERVGASGYEREADSEGASTERTEEVKGEEEWDTTVAEVSEGAASEGRVFGRAKRAS